jgi:hypothetical protein
MTPSRRLKPQISPLSTRSLPKIDVRYLRPLIFVVGALLFMGAVIVVLGLLKSNPVEAQPNAIWIGDEWTYRQHDEDDINAFVRQLRTHHIGTVYAHISDMDIDGTWTSELGSGNPFAAVQDNVTDFAQQFKRLYPEAQLLGIVGFPVGLSEDGYRLDDGDLQQAVARFSAQVVNSFGYDGVMLNVEPVWDGDDNFLNLLRQVRQAIGEDALMAVALPPDWTPVGVDVPTPAVIAPGTVWDRQYKQRLALVRANHLVVQAYNSYLTSPEDYTAWMAYQVETYAEAIGSLGAGSQVIIGVPAYPDALPAHDVRVENMLSALDGVSSGLEHAGDNASVVRGLMIYAGWSVDDREWQLFRTNWINR